LGNVPSVDLSRDAALDELQNFAAKVDKELVGSKLDLKGRG
jgi:hypothetical protein